MSRGYTPFEKPFCASQSYGDRYDSAYLQSRSKQSEVVFPAAEANKNYPNCDQRNDHDPNRPEGAYAEPQMRDALFKVDPERFAALCHNLCFGVINHDGSLSNYAATAS